MKYFTSIKTWVAIAALLTTGHAQAQTLKKATSGIVISKVFYAGTTLANSTKNYTGGEEYIELHNNTAQEVDLSGMMIGLVESEASSGAYLAGTITNPSYGVALKQLYQIPTDRVYAIKPYSTVVIAAAALDHRKLGKQAPDLSRADFEFGGMENDNAAVPNLNLLFTFNSATKSLNLTNGGDASLMLFSEKNGAKIGYDKEENYVYANGKDKGSRYLKVNGYYSMDAVEIIKTKAVDGIYTVDAMRKRINANQDAGYVPADKKMNKDAFVAYRKTALQADGQITLYDTGNSTVDFMVSDQIAPMAYNTVADGTTDTTVVIPESGYLPFVASRPFFTGNDLYIAYVTGTGEVKSYPGHTIIASNAPYVLVGTPGEHVVKYTEATRTLATAGTGYWLTDDNSNYANGVYTATTKNRFPMKFINEKGHVRFVADRVNNAPKTMKLDPSTESRYFMLSTTEKESIEWNGVTPADVATDITRSNIYRPANFSTRRYNLSGQRVGTAYKGLVIIGGKKLLIK